MANKQNQDMIAGCIWVPGTLKEDFSIKSVSSEISLDDNAQYGSWRLSQYQQGSVVLRSENLYSHGSDRESNNHYLSKKYKYF